MKELWGSDKLEAELQAAKDDLQGLELNIRKILGRDVPEGENGSVQPTLRVPQKRPLQEERRRQPIGFPNNDPGSKRRWAGGTNAEPKTVFSRLSARVTSTADDSGDEDDGTIKPAVSSRIIATPREIPSRQEVIRRESTDERSRQRNRRMFGALLGTLQKFRQEETKLKAKEDKKAEVEARVEEAKRKEKEELQKERQQLFINRKQQLAQVKALEAKLARSKQYQEWRSAQIPLLNFIKTKTQPAIYYLPKRSTPQTDTLLQESSKELKALIDKREKDLLDELDLIQKQAGLGKNQLSRSLSISESQDQSMAEEPEVENRDPNHDKNGEIKTSDVYQQPSNHTGGARLVVSDEKMDVEEIAKRDRDVDKNSHNPVFESSGKNFDFDRNSDKEDDRNSDKEDDRNSYKEDDRNSEKDNDRKSVKDDDRNSVKDDDQNLEKDNDKNSEKDTDRNSEKDNDGNSDKDDGVNSEINYIKNSSKDMDTDISSEKYTDCDKSFEKKINTNQVIENDLSLVKIFGQSVDFQMDRSQDIDVRKKYDKDVSLRKSSEKDAESDKNSDKEANSDKNTDKEVDTDKSTEEGESDKEMHSDDEDKQNIHAVHLEKDEKSIEANNEDKQNDFMQVEKIELPGETFD